MKINDIVFNVDLETILNELVTQLRINNIPYISKMKESGNSIQITCPYHNDGMERKPSAGIRKSDGMFHCFRGDTKVITREYGAVCMNVISDIPVHILNGDGVWEQVIFHNYGKQSLMKLTLSCNTKQKIIYATPEHEWLIKDYNRKYQTQNLKAGMYLEKCVPKKRNIKLDPKGIVHGFCYGDGNNFSHNKDKTTYYNRCFFYNKSDLELKQYFTDGKFSREVAGNGREYECVYFHSNINLKEVPSILNTDEYLMGFLAGYFVADGNCFNNKLTIYSHKYRDLYRIQQICTILGIMTSEIGVSNIKAGKRGCITVKEDTNGYTLRLARNTISDKFFITEKGRNSVQKYTGRQRYKVVKVERTDLEEYVYCCQTSTHSFALENFILTGNCFACNEVHTLPEVISYCLGYTDDALGKEGWKWLVKNFATIQVEERKDIELDFTRTGSSHDSMSNDSKHTIGRYVTEEELDTYRYTHPYWAKRKITSDYIIELFDLGYDKKTSCITFPVRDINGNCLFVARRSVKTKFFNYPEGVEKPLYGLYELTIQQERYSEIIVCESMLDALTCWEYGKYAVALNGLGNDLQFKQLRELPCRKLILATDNDNAGQEARKRIRQHIKYKLITEYVLPENRKDINELSREEFDNLEEIF